MFIRDTTFRRIYQKYDPFLYNTDFCILHKMDVNNRTHRMSRRKMLLTIHNYLFVQRDFHRTNHFLHITSRLRFANTKITSLFYLNYSYIINSSYKEGMLRSFNLIKNYLLFISLYARMHRQIIVPIEYLQCVEGGATMSMYEQTLNLLYRDLIADNLAN